MNKNPAFINKKNHNTLFYLSKYQSEIFTVTREYQDFHIHTLFKHFFGGVGAAFTADLVKSFKEQILNLYSLLMGYCINTTKTVISTHS